MPKKRDRSSPARLAQRFQANMERLASQAPADLPDDPVIRADLRRATEFQRTIERRIRRYNPETLVPALAIKMNEVRQNPNKLMAKWPPHFLFHAMEANCAYHQSDEPLRGNALASLVRLFVDFYEPAMADNLERNQGDLYLFFIHIARQQFYLQQEANAQDASRNLLLFDEAQFPRTLELMRQRFGFGFRDWMAFCVFLYAGLSNRPVPVIGEDYFRNSPVEVVPHDKLAAMFDLASTTVEVAGETYRQIRQDPRNLMYSLTLPSGFVDRPLLRLASGQFVATHVPLVFYRGFEGPYDISQQFAPFVEEFSNAFENYTGKVLRELNNVQVFTEGDMRRHTGRKISDYLVVGDDFALFLECKATKYSTTHTSENALKRDTSTGQIAKGVEQLYSGAEVVVAQALHALVGDIARKRLLGAVVTYGRIYNPNGDDYWTKIILPSVRANEREDWQRRLAHRPQVMSIAGLEGLILLANKQGRTLLELFNDKLAPSIGLIGDWEVYVGKRLSASDRFPLWVGAYENFFDDITHPH